MTEPGPGFDTGDAWSLRAIASTLPRVVTRDSALIMDGRVEFKAPPAIICPVSGHELQRGATTIEFEHAPESSRKQPVEGWVCECGESYVPGHEARRAHRLAMEPAVVADVSSLDDEKLLVLSCDGDQDAFSALYERLNPPLKEELRKSVDPATADSVAADVWLTAFERMKRGELRFDTADEFCASLQQEASEQLGLSAPSPASSTRKGEDLKGALAELDLDARGKLLMWMMGVSFLEMARLFGTSHFSIWTSVHQAMRRLGRHQPRD